jgi:tripartite-type tricarboxylate transporter receptor subunit TctC
MTSPWLRREFVEALSSGVNGRPGVAFPNPCEPTPGMAEPYRAGQFDLLAILSDERLEAFPDVPTAKEQGVDAVHANTYAVVALKGTPEDRLEVLDQAIAQVVQDPEFLAENQKINFDITYMNRAESKAHMEKVRERMMSIGQSLGF